MDIYHGTLDDRAAIREKVAALLEHLPSRGERRPTVKFQDRISPPPTSWRVSRKKIKKDIDSVWKARRVPSMQELKNVKVTLKAHKVLCDATKRNGQLKTHYACTAIIEKYQRETKTKK